MSSFEWRNNNGFAALLLRGTRRGQLLSLVSSSVMMLLRMIEINSLMPHYWSELILLADQLLNNEERDQLRKMIFEVECLVLETEVIPKEQEDGSILWVERIKGRLSLYDIEMAIESNPDYYAYFQREDGRIITKFDVERELDKIKKWLYNMVRVRAQGRRFQKFR